MAEKRGGESGELGLLERRNGERRGVSEGRVERFLECAMNWRILRVEEALDLKRFIVSGEKIGGSPA